MFQKTKWMVLLFSVVFLSSCKHYYSTAGTPDPQLITINQQIQEDSSITNYLIPYKQQFEKEMNIVIGESVETLTRKYTAHETTMGNFFADALLSIGQKLDPTVQVSFSTKGGIRADLPKGNITVSHMFEVMPFENKLVVLTISGEKFKGLLESIVRAGGQPVGGMTLTLTNTSCEDVKIGGVPFDVTKNYTIVTYDYLADGGDGVTFFHNPIKYEKYDKFVREGLIEYVKDKTAKGEKIIAQIDNRINDVRK